MGRQPCCAKIGLKRGPWTIEEDNKLIQFMLNNGIQCWRLVPKLAGLMRCGKSCRLRWINYLRPDLKRGAWTDAEEDMLFQLHSRLGNRWSKIAAHFPGRTDNEIKNHWNTKIKRKLKHLGLNPVTHMPNVLHDNTDQGIQDMQKSTCLSDDYSKPVCDDDNALNTSDYEVKSEGVISKCSSGEGSSSVLNNDMKECPKIGYDQVLNTEWDSIMEMNQFQSLSQTYDPFQNLIYSPLAWDAFSNFQDNFI